MRRFCVWACVGMRVQNSKAGVINAKEIQTCFIPFIFFFRCSIHIRPIHVRMRLESVYQTLFTEKKTIKIKETKQKYIKYRRTMLWLFLSLFVFNVSYHSHLYIYFFHHFTCSLFATSLRCTVIRGGTNICRGLHSLNRFYLCRNFYKECCVHE